MFNINRQLLLLLSCCFILWGCWETKRNTRQLCKAMPQLNCDQMNMNDGQCRVVRTNLIWHRKDVLDSPTDINIIKEFKLLKEYHSCLELAVQLELTKADNKEERRFNALTHVLNEEKRILEALKNFHTPEALYFLWTQGDQSALHQFLELEGTEKLNTAELQYALATYYISRDDLKTAKLLNSALQLSDKDNLNIDILESLASVNHTLKRKQRAYIWVLVSKEFGVPVASESSLTVLYNFSKEEKERLKHIADKIIIALKDGTYNTTMITEAEG